jgi:hypothetical protein
MNPKQQHGKCGRTQNSIAEPQGRTEWGELHERRAGCRDNWPVRFGEGEPCGRTSEHCPKRERRVTIRSLATPLHIRPGMDWWTRSRCRSMLPARSAATLPQSHPTLCLRQVEAASVFPSSNQIVRPPVSGPGLPDRISLASQGSFDGHSWPWLPITNHGKDSCAILTHRPRTIGLRARFGSHGAGSRLRFGWTARWVMRRIMARVTIASDTSGRCS